MAPTNTLEHKIVSIVSDALRDFRKKHEYLLHIDCNERSITYHIASSINNIIQDHSLTNIEDLIVDCEYNRDGHDTKKLALSPSDIRSDDLKSSTVYPDIIVHKRGKKGPNLLVIEAKKDRDQEKDLEKIKAYMRQLGYKFGLLLKIPIKKGESFSCGWLRLINHDEPEAFIPGIGKDSYPEIEWVQLIDNDTTSS